MGQEEHTQHEVAFSLVVLVGEYRSCSARYVKQPRTFAPPMFERLSKNRPYHHECESGFSFWLMTGLLLIYGRLGVATSNR